MDWLWGSGYSSALKQNPVNFIVTIYLWTAAVIESLSLIDFCNLYSFKTIVSHPMKYLPVQGTSFIFSVLIFIKLFYSSS